MRPELSVTGTATAIEGPLLFLRRNVEAGLNEAVEILGEGKPRKLGRVAALDQEAMVIEVLEPTVGLGLEDIRIRFLGEPLAFRGRPRPAGPRVQRRRPAGRRRTARRRQQAHAHRRHSDQSNAARIAEGFHRDRRLGDRPDEQSGARPEAAAVLRRRHAARPLASEIAQNARLRREGEQSFAIVFVGIGISHDTAEAFRRAMQDSGALAHTVMFLNLASESSTQRLLTPRFALTAAEYLAAEENRHVLVILTDMTNYCEALREVSASHGEVPSRKGYPGYMYSDLASIYERAGCLRGAKGTVTQLPILTMPAEDISHPIPDLTGYITEGQIVLDRALDHKGIFPPINVLPSLSRLMDQGIGEGYSHKDHPALANQLFASYAKAIRVRVLASVVGRDGLTELDRDYLEFADQFERAVIRQTGRRTLEESMAAGWAVLRRLPKSELTRLSDAQIAQYIEPAGAPHA